MLTPQSVSLTLFIFLSLFCSDECLQNTLKQRPMKHEDEQRPNNATNKSIINGKVLVLFVSVSLSAMVFLSYFPLVTTSSSSVLDKNAEDGLLLPIAKEELEEVLKEEQHR